MNRQKRRCPYCGKGMSYFSAYSCRRKAEYTCEKCGKESKVVISKLIIPIFIIAAVIALVVMGMWFFFKMLSNPLGIVLTAAPLLLFFALSPRFVQLEPLKKYRKSMEAKKAGIEFSDNLTALDFEDESASMDNSMQFKINEDLFKEIKSSRKSPNKGQGETNELVSHSEQVKIEPEEQPAVTQASGSTTFYPLKKLKNESAKPERHRHFIDDSPEAQQERAAKQAAEQAKAEARAQAKAEKKEAKEAKRAKRIQKDKPKKSAGGSRYSSDRRF